MSGSFGRLFGSSATGDKLITPLQSRVASATVDAMGELDTVYIGVVTGGGFGAQSVDKQTVAHAAWMACTLWQFAGFYLGGCAAATRNPATVPPDINTTSEELATEADAWTTQFIRLQAQQQVGAALRLASLEQLPSLEVNADTHQGIWQACEAVSMQVVSDLRRMRGAGVPSRFREAFKEILSTAEPNAAILYHLQQRWGAQPSLEARLDTVRQLVPIASDLFMAGQQIWAPYLLGPVYRECLDKQLALDELELGFDPWDLTDPLVRQALQKDPKAVQELTRFWNQYGHPMQTGELLAEVKAARAARKIRYVDGSALPYCPWVPRWLAVRTVEIGGVQLRSGDYFVLYAGRNAHNAFVSEIRRTGHFKLNIEHAP